MPMGNPTLTGDQQHPMHPDNSADHTIIYGKTVSQAKFDAWAAVKAGWQRDLSFPADKAEERSQYDTFSAEWSKTHPGE